MDKTQREIKLKRNYGLSAQPNVFCLFMYSPLEHVTGGGKCIKQNNRKGKNREKYRKYIMIKVVAIKIHINQILDWISQHWKHYNSTWYIKL